MCWPVSFIDILNNGLSPLALKVQINIWYCPSLIRQEPFKYKGVGEGINRADIEQVSHN
jgi:hypothetical protein